MGHLQADAVAIASARQLALDRAQQILDLFFIDIQIRVAGHPELITTTRIHAGEQIAHVLVDHRREKDEIVGTAVGFGRRQLDDPRQGSGGLYHGMRDLAPEGIGAVQIHDEVQRLVQNARKRMRRVQPDRADHRQQFFLEVAIQPGALFGLPFRTPQKPDIFSFQRRDQGLVERLILLVDQRMRALGDRAQHLARRARVGIGGRVGQLGLLFEPGHPHLEELIQIGRGNTQEFQPLE